MTTKTNLRKLIDRVLASKCETVKMGADVHARDIVVALQLDGALPEKPFRLEAVELVALATALVKGGLKVHVCQEAGPCGFGLHRQLLAAGARSLVVVPTALADGRQQKTDGLDATALLDKLDRYLRGNTKAFTAITVPTPQQEQDRAASRLRDQLKRGRQQWESRGRGLLLAQGHHVHGQWWRPSSWEALRPGLPAWLAAHLETLRTIILSLDTREKAARERLEAAAPKTLPKAVGALTWVQLAREICDWKRFKNRRQVASYTGLCPVTSPEARNATATSTATATPSCATCSSNWSGDWRATSPTTRPWPSWSRASSRARPAASSPSPPPEGWPSTCGDWPPDKQHPINST